MMQEIKQAQQLMDAAVDKLGRAINIMEVCGTHTVSIFRHGVRTMLPEGIKMLSGPGCPVCVTDQGYIDLVLQMADRDDCIVATYGDMVRVPGRGGSLETVGRSKSVKVVMSSIEALNIARENPDKTVVFVAVGFETTTPATAIAVKEAAEGGVDNFCIFSGHKVVIPAMDALLSDKNNKIDAFLCPGHVSVIIGSDAYEPVVEKYNIPCVVAGFEPVQIIEGIGEVCRQLAAGTAQVDSLYKAAVTHKGNPTAQQIVAEYFEPYDGYWRGLGKIPGGTLRLKEKYAKFDAMKRFNIEEIPAEELGGCCCGKVLCGLMDPPQCGLFGKKCTPDEPVGPCMVSSEGSCSAWYKYGRNG